MARASLKPPSAPLAPDAGDALETLVHQFADPLSFFRELVQNSVDAGSREVEIRFEYEPPRGGGEGAMVVHVDDWGEGMDRAIIDTQLTRLFSSSKEGDLTKIGKFGIGFVSVFALEPDAVCVDTSRGGENWRVLFRKDRTFTRIARDEPVEGTKVRLIKSASRDEFEKLRERAREVVAYWCRHLPAEVRFDGKRINEPLDLDLPVTVRHVEADTEVVAGYTIDGARFSGYYNKGLTLLEEPSGLFPGVAFKLSSRYLEHTLTRDNVVRDRNFDKAIGIVQRLVERELPARLFERLEEEVARDPESEAAGRLYLLATRRLERRPRCLAASAARRVFRDLAGTPVTLGAVREAARRGRLERSVPGSAVGEALARGGSLVLHAAAGGPAAAALANLFGLIPEGADERLCRPQPLEDGRIPAGAAALCRATADLLRAGKAKLSGVHLARFDTPASRIADRVAVTQRSFGETTPLDDARKLGASVFSRKRALVLNAAHPAVARLLVLAPREAELAAYLGLKLFFLDHRLNVELDAELVLRAMEARCRRRTA
ncbi:MAG: ATP-binding protein [Deltaproteobacteria bacterium]|nr:ATP-binding protein [Deltaproteobacteria bacterium]